MKKKEESTGAVAPGEKPYVLYVEDEDENFEVTQLRLGQKYNLLRARNAEEACRTVSVFGNKLMAILMDIQLSGSLLDGIQLTRLLRGSMERSGLPPWAAGAPTTQAPILFVTAYGARYSDAELKEAGGNFVMFKPVDFLKLSLGLANIALGKVKNALG